MSEIVPIARDSYRARILSTLDQEGMLTVADAQRPKGARLIAMLGQWEPKR